ncbi:hypothetical protein [Rhizobium herbae]|uniref:Uncharacterized protein n=1 Tax=Rhizobium herbae TaxID=508661 RepID=A0ABS4EUY2_9HYPH|nr:hypothetical protein [Rhizobium herbae]MBP1861763.1 hypothetical protein [Rhizobium herbae]
MKQASKDAYAAYEEDHRLFGAPKGAFSPTLRIKGLAVITLASLIFWSVVGYLVWG